MTNIRRVDLYQFQCLEEVRGLPTPPNVSLKAWRYFEDKRLYKIGLMVDLKDKQLF